MRKQVTLLSGLLLFAGAAIAQKNTDLPVRQAQKTLFTGKAVEIAGDATEKVGGDVLWANNFTSTNNWISSGVGAGATVDGTHGWGLAASPGAIDTWFFTTSVNSVSDGGYAVVQNGNPGPTPPTQPDQIPDVEWILTYDSIFDFSAYSDLTFQFMQSGARFIESQVVEVSTDGGTNWIEIGNNNDLPNLTAAGGAQFTNPTTRNYNVSQALGGAIPNSLMFRFRVHWIGAPAANSGVMYGWYIDDVKFIEGYANDLKLEKAFAFTGAQLLSYSKFPASQATSGSATTTVTGRVSNVGSASQDATIDIVNGAFSTSSPVTPIPAFSQDSLIAADDYTIPTTVGVSNFTVTAASDNNTLDNTGDDAATLKFEVTNNIMAVDAFTGAASSMTGAFTSFVGQSPGELTGIGTIFEIFEDGEIGAFDVGIANISGSQAQAPYIGKEYYVSFYRFDGNEFVYEDETAPRTIIAQNFGKIVKFQLPSTISVVAGDVVLAVATSFIGSEVPFAFSGMIPAGNTIGLAGTNEDIIGLASDDATPDVVEAPVVRLDFQSYVGLEEAENIASISAYPNPFNNNTEIKFDLKADAAVSVTVTDMAGRTVLTIPAANFATGTHTIALDGAAFEAGVYNCNVNAGGNIVTKRIVKK
jgi:hypothetical protein